MFGTGIFATAVLTLITPWAAKTNFYCLLAVRIVEGIFEGVVFPCIHAGGVDMFWVLLYEEHEMNSFSVFFSQSGQNGLHL